MRNVKPGNEYRQKGEPEQNAKKRTRKEEEEVQNLRGGKALFANGVNAELAVVNHGVV